MKHYDNISKKESLVTFISHKKGWYATMNPWGLMRFDHITDRICLPPPPPPNINVPEWFLVYLLNPPVNFGCSKAFSRFAFLKCAAIGNLLVSKLWLELIKKSLLHQMFQTIDIFIRASFDRVLFLTIKFFVSIIFLFRIDWV